MSESLLSTENGTPAMAEIEKVMKSSHQNGDLKTRQELAGELDGEPGLAG